MLLPGDAQQHAQATSIYPQLPSSAGVGSLPAQSPADDGASPGSDKKPRGRPKGSKNRVKPPPVSSGAVLSGGSPRQCISCWLCLEFGMLAIPQVTSRAILAGPSLLR